MRNVTEGFRTVYAAFDETNDLDAFVPELWANESIATLLENMVIGSVVNKNYSSSIASFGDVVNANKPGTFTAKRKGATDDVTIQDAEADNVPVKLDQHFHTSFVIRDEENAKSFTELTAKYLTPAIVSIAQAIDKVLLGQHVNYMRTNNSNIAGHLGLMSSTNAKDYMLDTREVMNANKVPMAGRYMFLNTSSETQILKDDDFTAAERVGDEGTALREASLGRKLGFDTFLCQNMSSITNANTIAGTLELESAMLAGATSAVVTNASATLFSVGDVILIGTDATPQLVTSVTLDTSADTDTLVISPGVKVAQDVDAVVSGAGVAYNNTARAAGYSGSITIDGLTAALPVGQQIRIQPGHETAVTEASGDYYTIISVDTAYTSNTIVVSLDRPLDTALIDNAMVSLYPSGDYNFAMTADAITLVSRPMATPARGLGALSAIAEYDDMAIRVTITYNGTGQGTLVTVDVLCGVAVLDDDLGAVMLG